jgi:hypothetical protein
MEKGQDQLHDLLFHLGEKLSRLTDQMQAHQPILKLVEGMMGIENQFNTVARELSRKASNGRLHRWISC